jgi:hypothetical protein
VCGPSSTRATKVPWHHISGEPTGVGAGQESGGSGRVSKNGPVDNSA